MIKVRGGPEERITVRRSRHGPIISDVSRAALDAAPRGYAIALAWTALAEDDVTMQAALRLARAGDWNEFLAAARSLHAPPQTASYADGAGNIGFAVAGRIPVRKPENLRGLAPAPGWDARYEWSGTIGFDELPRAFNPTGGAVVLANHKTIPPKYPRHITYEWQPPYRARRIEELLGSGKHDLESFKRMQSDVVSLAVRELLPRFLFRSSPQGAASLGRHHGRGARRAAHHGGLVARMRALYADELGPLPPELERAPVFLENVLAGQQHWCDDVRTSLVESCSALLETSFGKAMQDLKTRYGEHWSWGEAHVARHRHRPFLSRAVACAHLRHPGAERRRRLHRERRRDRLPRRGRAVRQPPRFEPAHDQRSRRPAGIGVHPLRRPVGQPALPALPRFRGRPGARRICR